MQTHGQASLPARSGLTSSVLSLTSIVLVCRIRAGLVGAEDSEECVSLIFLHHDNGTGRTLEGGELLGGLLGFRTIHSPPIRQCCPLGTVGSFITFT